MRRRRRKTNLQFANREGQLGSSAEQLFLERLRKENFPEPLLNQRLIPTRLWRYDFVWLSNNPYLVGVALEIQGLGAWGRNGAHQTAKGIANDSAKCNAITSKGWLYLKATTKQAQEPELLLDLFDALALIDRIDVISVS